MVPVGFDDDTLEEDIVILANQTLWLLTDGFSEMISDLVGGFLQGNSSSV